MKPILYIVIPCYNEQEVLPKTAPMFLSKINELVSCGKISQDSKILFVNDGSKDKTWDIICNLSKENSTYMGISLSRNMGHQNALIAGLMEARGYCDITISIDCDGQDDINAMHQMVDLYLSGSDIVYGVRDNRKTDTPFKRHSAQAFYKILSFWGAEVVYNHADYRLLSKKVLNEFCNFKEVNLFLRGLIPLIGFKSSCVYYKRHERLAGKTHYPLRKMISLTIDGITSLSIKPIRIITTLGIIISFVSFLFLIWSIVCYFIGSVVQGWASIVSVVALLGGIQLISLGVIGEYIGKIYLETKARPRYIISEKTYDNKK